MDFTEVFGNVKRFVDSVERIATALEKGSCQPEAKPTTKGMATAEAKPTIREAVEEEGFIDEVVAEIKANAWADSKSWSNLRSTGFKKFVNENLSALSAAPAEIQKKVRIKWTKIYEEAFPSFDGDTSSASTDSQEEKTPVEEKAPSGAKYTEADVREALKSYIKSNGKDKGFALMQKYGGAKVLSEVHADFYVNIMEAING